MRLEKHLQRTRRRHTRLVDSSPASNDGATRTSTGRGTSPVSIRLDQSSASGNRHMVDVQVVDELPPADRIAGVLVLTVPELLARKVFAYHRHR